MPNTYTISYQLPPPVSLAILSLEVYSKKSILTTPYTLVQQTVAPIVGNNYTYTTPSYNSHEVYDVYIESTCDQLPVPVSKFGERKYLVKTIANPVTIVRQVGSFDVTWESLLDPVVVTTPAESSLKEYILEYKLDSSPGPWTSITRTVNQMSTDWGISGTFPFYTYNINAGIVSGLVYNIRLTTVLRYNYITNAGPQLTDIVIQGPTRTRTAL
jgi:hypothetical protein